MDKLFNDPSKSDLITCRSSHAAYPRATRVFNIVYCECEYYEITCNFRCLIPGDAQKGIRRYQKGRQKSLIRKTDKTMSNKMKRKTKIENKTLH